MNRTRRVLMVAMVATALSADRLAAAAPAARPQVSQAARQFAGRLVGSFRRAIPAVRLREFRREEVAVCRPARSVAPEPQALTPFDASPTQYRLPPPLQK
jgi:hypothetical protein